LYIRSTDKQRISLLPYCASLLGFALALLSKEPGLTLPLMLLAHDDSFRSGQLGLNAKRLLPYAVVAAAYLAVRAHFRTALKLAPNYSDAHDNIGILYGRRGQADRAVSHFSDALRVRPDFPDARHNLGVAYLQAGRVEPAIEQFREVLRSSPRAVNTHLSLASAYEMKGLAEEARRHRQQARAIAGEAARR